MQRFDVLTPTASHCEHSLLPCALWEMWLSWSSAGENKCFGTIIPQRSRYVSCDLNSPSQSAVWLLLVSDCLSSFVRPSG